MSKPLFEHKTCTRCGGGGEYSYNQMHGSRCYGCSGTGYQLTARGKAAQLFLNGLRKVAIEELKVGDLILSDSIPGLSTSRWVRVTAVIFQTGAEAGYLSNPNEACVRIEAEDGYSFLGFVGRCRYAKGFTADEKKAQREQALAYQATLTKQGKPSKGRKIYAEAAHAYARQILGGAA